MGKIFRVLIVVLICAMVLSFIFYIIGLVMGYY